METENSSNSAIFDYKSAIGKIQKNPTISVLIVIVIILIILVIYFYNKSRKVQKKKSKKEGGTSGDLDSAIDEVNNEQQK